MAGLGHSVVGVSLARITTFALDGVESRPVWVEADIRTGLPAFTVVGLADKAVREARERVRAAIVNSGFEFPNRRITVNLAPAYLHKVGPSFDLPLAVAVLVAAGQIPADALEDCAVVGELSLAGQVRPIRGVLAIAEGTRRRGIGRLFVPIERAREASLVEGIEICGVRSLREIVDVLHGRCAPAPVPPPLEPDDAEPPHDLPDFSDVRGHNVLIGAVEVAAAGGHNLYMHGPPGTGKTMIARRIGSILPPLTPEEAIGVTRIHSVAGLHGGGGLVEQRPFRAPHHTISPSGLVGGGSSPTPGEVTLAHHGVLFLDELSEFPRSSLEALRQPLEDGRIAIVRGQRLVVYPSSCMLIAAANPCPCGMGEPSCRCTAADLSRHQRRLSGPLLDRIDVTLLVDRPTAEALETQTAPSSAEIRARVIAARERQVRRFARTEVTTNAQMTPRMLRELTDATSSAVRMLYDLHDRERLSARGHARVLRVARTVADLAGSDSVHSEHVSAAAHLRTDAAAAVPA